MSLSAPTYAKSGAKATTAAKLSEQVFGVLPQNFELVKLAYNAYLANGRSNLANTKTRGLVSGGGKKPWKQKGTGRARAGSIRSPIWRGGGITFGPTGQENYTKAISTASKRLALRQALSLAADEKQVTVIEAFEIKGGKTAEAAKLLSKLGAKGNVLIFVENLDEALTRALRNVPNVKVAHASYANVYDVLNADSIVVTKQGLAIIEAQLTPAQNGGKQ